MIYDTRTAWENAPNKRVMLFGMSGLGKTYVSNILRDTGDWFHYSVDYRIGTRYLGEHIADNAKREAMKVPFLRELLMTDSIRIESNITFDDLSPLASYLGKPGDPEKGGLPMAEYAERQAQHHEAEVAALMDTPRFIRRAGELYGYPHFVCDSSGSICEVVDPANPDDPVLKTLAQEVLLVWIEGSDAHTASLIERFNKAPKPMCYQSEFLLSTWNEYLSQNKVTEAEVDPDAFVRFAYARAMVNRQPRYAAMAKLGVTVSAAEVSQVKTAADFDAMIAAALPG